jgi:hypothetical protein
MYAVASQWPLSLGGHSLQERLMKVNLTDPKRFTLENVRALLASKDDSQHRQLRVTNDGYAYLSDDIGFHNLEGVKARFETWCQGNGYCGNEAAADPEYVHEIFDDLKNVWEKGLRGLIDYPPAII